MGYTDIKEWLDAQIAWRNEGLALKKLNSEIEAIDVHADSIKRIHVWGIEKVADIMSEKLQTGCSFENYEEVYFMYQDFRIFGLREKRRCRSKI